MNISLKDFSFLLFILFIVSIPSEGLFDIPGLGSMMKVMGVLFFCSVVILFFLGDVYPRPVVFHLLFVLVLLWMIFSSLWSLEPDLARRDVIKGIQSMFIVFLMWFIITNKSRLLTTYLGFVVGAFFLCLMVIRSFIEGLAAGGVTRVGAVDRNAVEFATVIADENEIAIIIAVALVLSVYVYRESSSKLVKMFTLFFVLPAIVTVLMTGSRTGLVVLSLPLIYLMYTLKDSSVFAKLLFSLILVAAVTLIILFIPDGTLQRLATTTDSVTTGDMNERTVIWKIGLNEWKEHPAVGIGLDSFLRVADRHHNDHIAHNTYVSLLVEQGLVGIILYLSLIVSLFYYIVRIRRMETDGVVNNNAVYFLFAVMFVILISQITLNLQNRLSLWVMYGLVIAHYGAIINNTSRAPDRQDFTGRTIVVT
jgi:O-antigen ligase